MFLAFQNAQPNLFLIIFGFAIAKFVFAGFFNNQPFSGYRRLKISIRRGPTGDPHASPSRPTGTYWICSGIHLEVIIRLYPKEFPQHLRLAANIQDGRHGRTWFFKLFSYRSDFGHFGVESIVFGRCESDETIFKSLRQTGLPVLAYRVARSRVLGLETTVYGGC